MTVGVDGGKIWIKVGSTWKKGQVFIKVSGSWKRATGVYVKVGSSWKSTV